MKVGQISAVFLVLAFANLIIYAQTTAFSYQGRLVEAGTPATGNRVFRFTLFDGNGAAAFSGANQSLEIAVNRRSQFD